MTMFNEGLRSSATDLWATPQAFFDRYNAQYHFTLDVCVLCPRPRSVTDTSLQR